MSAGVFASLPKHSPQGSLNVERRKGASAEIQRNVPLSIKRSPTVQECLALNSASSHNSSQGAAIVEYVDGAANALELPPSLLDELVRSSSAVKAAGDSPPQATASGN
ncbi:MAG: hypothetical protein R3C56_16625 [Pirellulaceae bacterium]